MMAHWVCELFTFMPAFLYVAAAKEGKTLTEKIKKEKRKKEKKKKKERKQQKKKQHKSPGKWDKTIMRKRSK